MIPPSRVRRVSAIRQVIVPIVTLLCTCALGGCHKTEPSEVTAPVDPGKSGPGVFTASPLALSDIAHATPLGNIYPPGHTLPTDHVYFYYVDPEHRTPGDMDTPRTVYAPGDGILVNINAPGPRDNDYGIDVKMTNTFFYFLGHLLLAPGIRVGDRITAGEVIGTTSKGSFALDFGVINTEVTLGFIRPDRYLFKTLHAVAPYGYYARPLRDSLHARIPRLGQDKGGKIDYDISGRLVGNWFLEGLPLGAASFDSVACTKHLAIVYDMMHPSEIRIAIGGTLSVAGLFGVDASSPDPAGVAAAQGIVVYKMILPFLPGTPSDGVLLAQVLSGDRIKVETFRGGGPHSGFDSNAVIYTR